MYSNINVFSKKPVLGKLSVQEYKLSDMLNTQTFSTLVYNITPGIQYFYEVGFYVSISDLFMEIVLITPPSPLPDQSDLFGPTNQNTCHYPLVSISYLTGHCNLLEPQHCLVWSHHYDNSAWASSDKYYLFIKNKHLFHPPYLLPVHFV
jgi:hypothetical protein